MKCFSDFASFCRRRRTRPPQSLVEDDALSRPSRAGIGSRRRRRSNSGTAAHWRPGLTAISEDAVVPTNETRTDRSRKKSASKKGSVAGVQSYSFSHAEEYYQRPSSMSMSLPMFSPTPFMF